MLLPKVLHLSWWNLFFDFFDFVVIRILLILFIIDKQQNTTILVGMAGAAGDCLTLIERLEQALDQTAGNLTRACVALAKAWRTEKYKIHDFYMSICIVSRVVDSSVDVF